MYLSLATGNYPVHLTQIAHQLHVPNL